MRLPVAANTALQMAGAIGGTIGAYLVRDGYDVTFVDVAANHVAAIGERGLRKLEDLFIFKRLIKQNTHFILT